jgi:hypothetical protein
MASRSNIHALTPIRPFRAEDLRQLTSIREWPCISIHLTTHRRFPEWRQDPVRFKSLLARVEAEILPRHGGRDLESLLEPLKRMLDDESVWEHALDGLAIFASPSYSAAFRVPVVMPDAAIVADTFHTKPLFRFQRTNSAYYVLAVSQNAVTLFQGSQYGAEPVELRSLPHDLVQALGGLGELDEHQKGFTAHGGGVMGRQFSGRGPGREDRKENLIKFFRALDKGLHEFLRPDGERAPLLLAAVRYYHPIYREANTYPHLLADGLDGNYERAKGDQIHAEAWPIVSGEIDRRVAEWVDRFRSLHGKGLAVDGIHQVAAAVVQGRVWCVLASEDESAAGRLDRATGEVTLGDGPESIDLIDDVCEEAWKRGAEIFVVPRTSLPTPNPIAAVLRF